MVFCKKYINTHKYEHISKKKLFLVFWHDDTTKINEMKQGVMLCLTLSSRSSVLKVLAFFQNASF